MEMEPHWFTNVMAAEDFATTMQEIHTEVQAALSKAQNDMKEQADWHQSPTPDFKTSDQVLMYTHNHSLSKLSDHWLEPYTITKVLPSQNTPYSLENLLHY